MFRGYFFTKLENTTVKYIAPLFRTVGQSLYDSGTAIGGRYLSNDRLVPSLRCVPISGSKFPRTLDCDWVAPNATIVGDVSMGEGSSLWHGVILRGDLSKITVGKNTIIQDNTIVSSTKTNQEIKVGDNVFIGPACTLEGC